MSAAAISIAILLTVSMLLTDSRLTREHLDTQLTMAHPVCLAAFLTFYIFLTCGGYPRAVNVRWTFPFLNSSVDMDSIALSGRFLSTPIFFYVKMIWQKVLQPEKTLVIKIPVVRTVMCKGELAKFLRGANMENRLRRMRTGLSNQKSTRNFESFDSLGNAFMDGFWELGGSFKGSFKGQSARIGNALSGNFKGKSGGFGSALSGSFKGQSGGFKGQSGSGHGSLGSGRGGGEPEVRTGQGSKVMVSSLETGEIKKTAVRTEPGLGRGSKVTLPPLETGETKKVSSGVELRVQGGALASPEVC
mmetsp:Transcript_46175/g.128729  ORF Transcript_46175/g.128729 Transcript_46175/m.128729 type:complete len:303 (+) Transcript_46175:72-980(+)